MNQKDFNKIYTRHARRVWFYGILGGIYYHNKSKELSVCHNVPGKPSYFHGRKVCEIDNHYLGNIDECWQREKEDQTTMIAVMKDGSSLLINPTTLNKWRQSYEIKKDCHEKTCVFMQI